MTAFATRDGVAMPSSDATAPARLVGPCMQLASSCTTPSSFGRPPRPTEVSSGSSSWMTTPSMAASSGSRPWRMSSTARPPSPPATRYPLPAVRSRPRMPTTLTPPEIRARLREMRFLDGLTDGDYHFLASHVVPVEFELDHVIFREGQQRSRMHLLTAGAVAIEKGAGEGVPPVRLATLGPGEAIGEGLLLDESIHGTTARALEPTRTLAISREELRDIVNQRPTLYAALVARAARAISQRLRATDATLVGRGRAMGFTGGGPPRVEHDLLGQREVPADALYGVQTLRALENFPITGVPLREFPELVEALAAVKEAAADRK